MRKDTRIAVCLALVAGFLPPVLTGCGKDTLDQDVKVSVPVSVSVGDLSRGLETKMTEKIVQSDDPRTFRGIQTFYVVPFTIAADASSSVLREYVRATDPCLNENIQLSSRLQEYDFTGAEATKGFYSPGSYVSNLTNAVLVYGQAKEEASAAAPLGSIAYKRHNGSILPNAPVVNRTSATKAEELAFDLESFLSNTQAAFDGWKTTNLNMLTAIASVEDGGAKFREPSTYNSDADLAEYFKEFTDTTFSAANEGAVLTRLYNSCKTIPGTADPTAKNLAAKVCETIDGYTTGEKPMLSIAESAGKFTVTMARDVCTEFGLPAGAVAFLWGEWRVGREGSGFGSPEKSEGVNLAPVADYCYPPALWYFTNSPLMATSLDGMQAQFEDRTRYPQWSDIVNAKNGSQPYYTRGVVLDSKSALVREPLQYAVALLKLKINGPATPGAIWLADKKNKQVSIDGTSFPLTGIIIGSQRTQNFDFTASTADMRFTFDADVNDASGNPQAWISSSETSATLYTLAFETRPQEDVYFALEFRNDSGDSFTGVHDTVILPGSKFYLVGEMAYDTGTTTNPTKPDAVFVKDHITTLNVNFQALASAYSILPELTSPDLQLGVGVRLNWDAVTPSSYELQ